MTTTVVSGSSELQVYAKHAANIFKNFRKTKQPPLLRKGKNMPDSIPQYLERHALLTQAFWYAIKDMHTKSKGKGMVKLNPVDFKNVIERETANIARIEANIRKLEAECEKCENGRDIDVLRYQVETERDLIELAKGAIATATTRHQLALKGCYVLDEHDSIVARKVMNLLNDNNSERAKKFHAMLIAEIDGVATRAKPTTALVGAGAYRGAGAQKSVVSFSAREVKTESKGDTKSATIAEIARVSAQAPPLKIAGAWGQKETVQKIAQPLQKPAEPVEPALGAPKAQQTIPRLALDGLTTPVKSGSRELVVPRAPKKPVFRGFTRPIRQLDFSDSDDDVVCDDSE